MAYYISLQKQVIKSRVKFSTATPAQYIIGDAGGVAQAVAQAIHLDTRGADGYPDGTVVYITVHRSEEDGDVNG